MSLAHRARAHRLQSLEAARQVVTACRELLGDVGDERGHRADVVLQRRRLVEDVVHDEIGELTPLFDGDASSLVFRATTGRDEIAQVDKAGVELLGPVVVILVDLPLTVVYDCVGLAVAVLCVLVAGREGLNV